MLVKAVADSIGAKGFRDGTDRLVPPAETLQRIQPLLAGMGITRLANVTGLDIVGIPVAMATRPNSRSLAVSQGKGLTLQAALVSAAMESVEGYHAESVQQPLRYGTHDELRTGRRLVELAELPTITGSAAPHDVPLLWIEGTDLVAGEPVWLPFDLVHLDMTARARPGAQLFAVTSNGLASGNHWLEALSHAICELIERDAIGLWTLRPPPEQAQRRLDLATVDDPACRTVLNRFAAAGVAVAVWDMTTDVGLACFRADIAEDPDRAFLPLGGAGGSGCHPRREIALLRALTEAAQSRLTAIAGSRDDISRLHYDHLRHPNTMRRVWTEVSAGRPTRALDETPTFVTGSFAADVALEIEQLRAVGVTEVVAVDLTRDDIGIPVARAVIPGLEACLLPALYRPGRRAQARLAALR